MVTGYVCVCWALRYFSKLGLRWDIASLISCSTLILTWHLLFVTVTTKNPALQICDLIRRNGEQIYVETVMTASCSWQVSDIYRCVPLEHLR